MNNKNFSLDAILEHLSIKQLNPMQEASIEANLQHNEVILRSATGSGKTIGYLLPLLNLYNPEIPTTQSLIVVPSRELAQQIELVFKQMGTGLKITACYGGHLRETEENNLKQAPAIIVGTPGRLCDHIRRNNITIASINTLVLDEYDKSLELGFEEEMELIVTALPH
jgi:superfamily II DNA/RNA helicase